MVFSTSASGEQLKQSKKPAQVAKYFPKATVTCRIDPAVFQIILLQKTRVVPEYAAVNPVKCKKRLGAVENRYNRDVADDQSLFCFLFVPQGRPDGKYGLAVRAVGDNCVHALAGVALRGRVWPTAEIITRSLAAWRARTELILCLRNSQKVCYYRNSWRHYEARRAIDV